MHNIGGGERKAGHRLNEEEDRSEEFMTRLGIVQALSAFYL